MMVFDHVGDQEAMVHAQLGQQPLARTTETSLQPRQGALSCLRAQPPDLADLTVARPKVACVPLAGLRPPISILQRKRTAVTRSLVSLIEKRTFCRHFEHTSRGTTHFVSLRVLSLFRFLLNTLAPFLGITDVFNFSSFRFTVS